MIATTLIKIMFSHNCFNLFTIYLALFLIFLNLFKAQKLINSYNLFKGSNCEENGIQINSNNQFQLNFDSKLRIDCKFTFDYPSDCFNQTANSTSKVVKICDNITFDIRHPEELESNRFKINTTSHLDRNQLVLQIVFDFSSFGKKNNGQYLVGIRVKRANESNSESYLAANFLIEIKELGNSNDRCSFPDQCYSNVCRDTKCICSKEAPISHDENCLKSRKLLEACYVTEQCQFGGVDGIICKDINGNKSCQCLPEYIFLEKPQPRCLSPKHYNESCELSEECQWGDGNSYCSAYGRCECIAKHKIDKNKECSKGEVASVPYAIIFGTIAGLIAIVIIAVLVYKYYFLNRFPKQNNSKPNDLKHNSKLNAILLEKLNFRPQNDRKRKENKLKIQETKINMSGTKSSEDEISVENDNIYDDVQEIRYVTNQMNAKTSSI